MYNGGLLDLLEREDCVVGPSDIAALTDEEDHLYGDWRRAALESRHIGSIVSQSQHNEFFTIGLLRNCSDLLGMLAGLQNMKSSLTTGIGDSRDLQGSGLAGEKPLRVGLVWIDAHADFNTPETTLSGMLGGMPVAMASGICLTRLRLTAGLDPALPTKYITMTCLRDVDPLEQDLLDRSQCEYISVGDVRNLSENINDQIERLCNLTDIVYVHIDMDVLDPAEVSGHPLTAPEGPSSRELAAALEIMFTHEKVNAIGIASIPYGQRDPNGESLAAAYRLIEGAIKGLKSR